MNRRLSVLFLVFVFSISASAQETPPAPKDTTKPSEVPFYELEEVVVTAARTARSILRVPMAIDVVGLEEIRRGQATVSLNEIFRTLPGISADNRYNAATGERLVIRGSGSRGQFGIRGTKILLDGIPLTTPDGATSLTTLSLGSIARVEVIRGPASALYGNASTGVINMTTAIGQNTPLAIQTKATAGSYGLRKLEGSALGRSGNTGYALNVNRTVSDGYRTRSELELVRVGAVGTHDLSGGMQLVGSFNYYNAPYLLNPGALTKTEINTNPSMAAASYLNAGAGRRTKQWIGGLTFKYNDGASKSFDATIHYMSRDQTTWTPPSISASDIASGGVRVLYRNIASFGSMPVQWAVGADYDRYNDDRLRYRNRLLPQDKRGTTSPDQVFGLVVSDTLAEAEANSVNSIGPFAELEVELTPRWILLLGGRYDRFTIDATDKFLNDGSDDSGSRTMTNFSPSAGLLFRAYQYTSVYGNVSTGFQVPTINELRNRELGVGGINFDLKPERVTSIEAGIKGVIPVLRLTYDLSLFYANYNDMLIPYQIPGGADIFYRNAGRTINRGVEGKLQWEPLEGMRNSLAFTLMDFTFDDFIVEQTVSGTRTSIQLGGKKVPGVSPGRIYIGTSYRHRSGMFSEVYLQWVDKSYTNDFNGTPPGGTKPADEYLNDAYANIDARLGFTQTIAMLEIEVFAGVNNLLDKKYNASLVPNATADRFYEPTPGRNWYGGLSILFLAIP